MRLIDADRLPVFDMTDNINGNAIVTHWIQLDFITNAPAVKAIPVGWIKAYTRKSISVADYWAIVRMVLTWEKSEGRQTDEAD